MMSTVLNVDRSLSWPHLVEAVEVVVEVEVQYLEVVVVEVAVQYLEATVEVKVEVQYEVGVIVEV